MRQIRVVLPVLAVLLSGGTALAATATTSTQANGPAASTGSAPASPSGKAGGRTTLGSGKFSTESEAAKACGASNVVWGNTSTKVFHVQGDQYYGHTKRGAFMCKATATAGGFHQAGQTAHKG